MLTKKTKSLFSKFVESFLRDLEENINEKNAIAKFELLELFNYDEELLTSKEVCTIYKISHATLERYIRKGLKFTSKNTGCKRTFKKSDVENFINLNNTKNGR